MKQPPFSKQTSQYFNGLRPAKRGIARWRQYEREKAYLLTLVSPDIYDAALRTLADKLRI